MCVDSLVTHSRRGLWILAGTAAILFHLDAVGVAAGGGSWFGDDDGSVHEPAIDALAAGGVLEGTDCGDGLFCPGEPTQRWVIAVWLVRALDESPTTTETATRFADVDAEESWTPYVERLADVGVTEGCGSAPTRR